MSAAATTPVLIPYPVATEPRLRLRLGPCALRVAPSAGPDWITGSYDDRGTGLPIAVHVDGATATLAQGFSPRSFASVTHLPQLELAIGTARPFALAIEAGASESSFDLGGLPITSFELKVGAGKYDIDFSRANLGEMHSMELSTGAGAFAARHLANANFAALRVGGGVAGCTLDFSGDLRRDAVARIDAGLASVDVVIPTTTAVHVDTKAFAANVDAIGALTRRADGYFTAAAIEGRHPLLSIQANVAFGQLTLRTV